MASALTRSIAAAGAAAFIAGTAIVATPSAHADGAYYGTWNLVAATGDGQKVKCDSPDASSGACPAGETLVLKSNYRYKVSAYLAQIFFLGAKGNGKGSFVAPVFPATGDQALVFEGDASGIMPLGSAWQMVLKDTRSGSPTKMILTLQTGFGEVGLIFRRDGQ